MAARLIVEADGGSRGNPGPAGYGAVVRDAADGQALLETAESIGRATNNVAEYHGLIAGLRNAVQFAPSAVEVRMDSKLVVEQMSGRWRVKHPDLIPLYEHARSLLRELPDVRFTWVPRGRNAEADRLANEAMDAAARGESWQQTSSESAPVEPAEPPAADEPEPAPPRWLAVTGDPTTTVLVRHGQTAHSAGGLFSGRNDLGLTATGRAQAAAIASALRGSGAERIVTSPLRRSRDTAAALERALKLPLEIEDDLAECDFGAWEGLPIDEVARRWPDELAAWRESAHVAPPGGESFAAMTRRVAEAKDRLHKAHPGRRLLVVSHVGPIKALLQTALQATPALLFRMHLDVAGISTVQWYDDGLASVRSVNDTHHLDT